jgi:predicted solute-binding protein
VSFDICDLFESTWSHSIQASSKKVRFLVSYKSGSKSRPRQENKRVTHIDTYVQHNTIECETNPRIK